MQRECRECVRVRTASSDGSEGAAGEGDAPEVYDRVLVDRVYEAASGHLPSS